MAIILVIDDDEAALRLMPVILKRGGHVVVTANNGRAGIECAQTQQVDAIILDDVMPGLTGLEVLRQLKADEKTRLIPVIMNTGRSDSAYQQDATGIGASAILPKPALPQQILDTVSKVLPPKPPIEASTPSSP